MLASTPRHTGPTTNEESQDVNMTSSAHVAGRSPARTHRRYCLHRAKGVLSTFPSSQLHTKVEACSRDHVICSRHI